MKHEPTYTREIESGVTGILKTAGSPGTRIIICLVAVLFVCLTAATSFASWSVQFSQDQVWGNHSDKLDKIEIFDVSSTGGNMENPGMGQFSKGSWTVDMPNSNYSVATESGVNNFSWNVYLSGTSTSPTSNPITLAALAYIKNQGGYYGTWMTYTASTQTWTFATIQNLNLNDPRFNRTASAVPVPSTVLLLVTGFLSLAGLRKKLKE
ncbi:MAG TPA: PEP-CTERM sorting domain-containing protein [Syntrophorhabdaceae bacterium]|nr:PEP-CTERM sorting domain-containing protein [Syntrophorhabdaceae bacterium]